MQGVVLYICLLYFTHFVLCSAKTGVLAQKISIFVKSNQAAEFLTLSLCPHFSFRSHDHLRDMITTEDQHLASASPRLLQRQRSDIGSRLVSLVVDEFLSEKEAEAKRAVMSPSEHDVDLLSDSEDPLHDSALLHELFYSQLEDINRSVPVENVSDKKLLSDFSNQTFLPSKIHPESKVGCRRAENLVIMRPTASTGVQTEPLVTQEAQNISTDKQVSHVHKDNKVTTDCPKIKKNCYNNMIGF